MSGFLSISDTLLDGHSPDAAVPGQGLPKSRDQSGSYQDNIFCAVLYSDVVFYAKEAEKLIFVSHTLLSGQDYPD